MTANRRPTRATVAGRAYLDLQNLARRQHRPTDELQQLFALEGFLARLASSPHAEQLVLKGGMLLAAYGERRPTRDVDMQAQAVSGERDLVLSLVRVIAMVPIDDGLVFETDTATAEIIRDDDEYSGVRVSLTATLASAKLSLHVDVNIGDPIWPAPRVIDLPRLLGGTLALVGYPLPMVCAEKIITALHRGTANTRWRDFADLFLLTGRHTLNGADLQQALAVVAAYRRADLSELAVALNGYPAIAQARWSAWRRKQHLEDRLPSSFGQVSDAVIGFADPALTAKVAGREWDPSTREWTGSLDPHLTLRLASTT